MNDIFFSKEFTFNSFSFRACHHSDNTHGIEWHYFAVLKKGTVRIVTSEHEEYFFQEGDVFYLPRGCRYRSHWRGVSESNNCVEWDSLGFKTFPDVDNKSYKLQKLSVSEKQAEYLDEICADMAISPKNVGYLYLFLAEAVKSMVATPRDSKSLIVERARKYIDEHNELHVSELAKHCNMSESGLYKFFRDNLNTTPIGFKNQIKVNRAVNMLKYTSASVEEISTELGFSNAAYFRKIFKSHTGKTPLKIRKEAKHI